MSEPDRRSRIDDPAPDAERLPAGAGQSLGDVIARRFSRRDVVRGALAVAAISAAFEGGRRAEAGGQPALGAEAGDQPAPAFDFAEIEAGVDETHRVADDHAAEILLRWGDPLFPDTPAFDPAAQSAARQERQFGYNNDFVGFIPLDGSHDRGLLVVNHEYTNADLMFPERADAVRQLGRSATRADLAAIEMAAHGGSVVEIRREGGRWRPVIGSPYTRRLTATTPMAITGPAAGHPRLRTRDDPTGRHVLGTVNNCSGGVTPWGTWLSGEENFHYYFVGRLPDDHPEAENARRYRLGKPLFGWGRFHERFDLAHAPHEPNRFGWVVEIDPFDPSSTPRKRTALGRTKHEGAAGIVNRDGRYVIYLGDDERFEYVYRFVTEGAVDPVDRAANRDLLDAGTLSVACFEADGTGRWRPLVHGRHGLDAGAGFESQADVLIETRRAADTVGGTRMDRPEDIEASPVTGRVYVMLTNNSKRTAAQVDGANPRAANLFGHIVEILPEGDDHAAEDFRWDVLVRCGDPEKPEVKASFSESTTRNGWFGMPDNCAFDGRGRLWVATDGNSARRTGRSDGIWALETDGPGRGTGRHFFRVPRGAEMCGPCFTPDDETLFLAVQHPGEADEGGPPSHYDTPSTRWPDFQLGLPPRPSVVAVTRKGGGRVA